MDPLSPTPLRAQVITVSDRSHRGERHDASGPLLASLLSEQGLEVSPVVVVPDEVDAIRQAVTSAAAVHELVVTTGGTGVAPRDVTPEAVAPLLDRQLPGVAEALRRNDSVPTAVLSRSVAGTLGRSLVVALPGSPGGVRDGAAVLAPLVAHVVAQLAGEDH